MHYRLTQSGMVIRVADNAFIPADEGNTDYQQFLKDQAEGAVVEPYAPPPFSPKAALARMHALRGPMMTVLASMMADALADNLPDDRVALRTARRGLQDVPTHPPIKAMLDNPAGVTDAAFDQAVLVRFEELRQALPTHLRKGFRELAG